MVEHGVNNHLDAVLVRLFTHRLKFSLCSQRILAVCINLEIERLIVRPPYALHGFSHCRFLDHMNTCRLNRGKALLRNFLQIIFNAVVAPVPYLKNLAVLCIFNETVVRTDRLVICLSSNSAIVCSGICRDTADRNTRQQNTCCKNNTCHFFVQ